MNSNEKIRKIITEQFNGDTALLERALNDYKMSQQSKLAATQRPDLTDAPTIIELKSVGRSYKLHRNNTVTALNDVSLDIKQGEFVAITGASGSGKSTLMHIIGGIDTPDTGSVIVDGQQISGLSQRKLARYRLHTVGFVFQFFYLQPFLNVARNIEVPMMFAGAKRGARRALIQEVSGAVGLSDRLKHQPKQLSGGQVQRTAIARALINKPKILLADEPTGNLDSTNGAMIIDLLRGIREKDSTTIVIVTHDAEIAAQADRVIRLSDGAVA